MRTKKKQFMVLGLSSFGASVAKMLCELGHEVLAVDRNAEAVEAIAPYVTQSVQADATDEEVLRSFEPASFDAAIVAIGGTDMADSMMVSMLCKEAGVPYVVTKAADELHAKVLSKIGVDRVIFPERDMGQRLAKALVSPGILEMMELANDYQLAEVLIPDSWVGRTLSGVNVRRVYNVNVLAIQRGKDFIASPHADSVFQQDDMVLVLGKQNDIDAINQR